MSENIEQDILFGQTSPPMQIQPEKKPFYNNPKFFIKLVQIIIIIIALFLILKEVNSLDKQSICLTMNLSINDCDTFWEYLTNRTTIILQPIVTNITNIINQTFFNETILNYTFQLPENLDNLKEKNRHDEEIARISKGIISSNGSTPTIVLGDFVRKDEFGGLFESASAILLKVSDFGSKFEEFYGQKQININSTLQVQEIEKPILKWYETPGFIISLIIAVCLLIFAYNKGWLIKKKETYQQQTKEMKQINVIMPEEPIHKKIIPKIEEETEPEIKMQGE